MDETPKGVTAVLIDPHGRVSADASDFDPCHPSGFSVVEAQTLRAKKAVAQDYVRAACNDYVWKAIGALYPGPDGIVSELCRNHGFRLHFVKHGHAAEE